jgi:hypothetical protein
MAPLVARHTSRRFLVSRQVLESVSLVTHSAALTIVTQLNHIFALYHDKQYPLQAPRRKNPDKKQSYRSFLF